jgi:hypothetical protein
MRSDGTFLTGESAPPFARHENGDDKLKSVTPLTALADFKSTFQFCRFGNRAYSRLQSNLEERHCHPSREIPRNDRMKGMPSAPPLALGKRAGTVGNCGRQLRHDRDVETGIRASVSRKPRHGASGRGHE